MRDRHKPSIVGGEKVGPWRGGIRAANASQRVDIDAATVDVAHGEMAAILRRVGVAVKIVNATIG